MGASRRCWWTATRLSSSCRSSLSASLSCDRPMTCPGLHLAGQAGECGGLVCAVCLGTRQTAIRVLSLQDLKEVVQLDSGKEAQGSESKPIHSIQMENLELDWSIQ